MPRSSCGGRDDRRSEARSLPAKSTSPPATSLRPGSSIVPGRRARLRAARARADLDRWSAPSIRPRSCSTMDDRVAPRGRARGGAGELRGCRARGARPRARRGRRAPPRARRRGPPRGGRARARPPTASARAGRARGSRAPSRGGPPGAPSELASARLRDGRVAARDRGAYRPRRGTRGLAHGESRDLGDLCPARPEASASGRRRAPWQPGIRGPSGSARGGSGTWFLVVLRLEPGGTSPLIPWKGPSPSRTRRFVLTGRSAQGMSRGLLPSGEGMELVALRLACSAMFQGRTAHLASERSASGITARDRSRACGRSRGTGAGADRAVPGEGARATARSTERSHRATVEPAREPDHGAPRHWSSITRAEARPRPTRGTPARGSRGSAARPRRRVTRSTTISRADGPHPTPPPLRGGGSVASSRGTTLPPAIARSEPAARRSFAS